MSDRDAWLNPAIWLQHLSLLDGKAQSKTWKDASENRRQDQLAIDLTSYEYVRTQYASLIEAGRMHLISEMALLCRQMASLNKAAGDLDGAVWCLDQAISSYGKVACETPGYEAIAEMAWCKMAKAVNLTYKPGITEIDVFILYDSAISDLNNLIENLGQRHLISFLSQCYLNISVSLHFFGKNSEALETCNEAINLCLDPLLDSSDRDLAERLVKAYINKASILNRIGQFLDASNLLDSAIQVCERRYLPEELQQLDLLALCYLEKGNCLINKPDDTALAHYEKAKTIFYKLVNQGLDEQAENLAFTLLQLGIYQANLRALDKALDLFDEALELFQRLVTQEGRVHLGREWLAALFNKGNVHLELGETDKAIDAYRETIQLLERDPFPRPAYHPNLAVCEVKLAMSLAKGGQKGDAIATYRRAVLTYYRLIAENTCNLGLCIECAVAQSKLAQLLREEGWMDEAESEFGQAIKMLRGLECKTGDKRVTKTIENIRKQKHINRG
jgi:tetratricopeptide (TPR) repeat protein